jgi:hypothetical protein
MGSFDYFLGPALQILECVDISKSMAYAILMKMILAIDGIGLRADGLKMTSARWH